ncbi:hypothetical protein [Pseudorhodoferax sp.]|uniref:hypothetical protein n=1 Tax=Pseudorhodoferax sp. TaxID=1993553 RepID=UPI0039E5D9AB
MFSRAGRELRRAGDAARQAAILAAVCAVRPDLRAAGARWLAAVVHRVGGAHGWVLMKEA